MSQPSLKTQIEETVAKIVADHKINAQTDPILSKLDTSKAVSKEDVALVGTYQRLLGTSISKADALLDTQEFARTQQRHNEWLKSNNLST